MKEKLEAAKAVLKKYGQEQLLSNYEKLSEESKSKLLDEILTVDFNRPLRRALREMKYPRDPEVPGIFIP